ncbi:Uncharacterized protein FWK35_00026342, partial [Aphis craccivora]
AFTGHSGPLPQQPLASTCLGLLPALPHPSSLKSLTTLSFHLCLGRPLGLFVFGFHFVTCPIGPSDLHTCPAQLSLLLFKIPLIFGSPYRSWIS